MKTNSHEAISLRAYYIWEEEGRPAGRSAQHWELAVAQLRAEQGKAAANTVAARPRGKAAKPAVPARPALKTAKVRKSVKSAKK